MFSWCPSVTDPTWLQVIIWRSIKALLNLRHLTLYPYFSKIPVDLHALTELESISILGTPRTGADQLSDNLAKLYASSPRLTSLEVRHNQRSKLNNLHHLFHIYNDKSPPRRLRHLGLDFCFVRLDKVTLPHLRHLTSLNLRLDQVGQDVTPGIVDIASSPDEIWKNFIGFGIHLQELKLYLIATSLIDYLLSYSGLKKLHLTVTDSESDNREQADLFFNKCLVNHADTLEELILIACEEGPWNFCSNNSRSIAKCTKLKFLALNLFLETRPPHWDFCYADVVVSRSLTMFCCPITLL